MAGFPYIPNDEIDADICSECGASWTRCLAGWPWPVDTGRHPEGVCCSACHNTDTHRADRARQQEAARRREAQLAAEPWHQSLVQWRTTYAMGSRPPEEAVYRHAFQAGIEHGKTELVETLHRPCMAKAWDEGYDAGDRDCYRSELLRRGYSLPKGVSADPTPNPYAVPPIEPVSTGPSNPDLWRN